MEVEVKLRLPDSQSYQNLCRLLSPFLTQTLIQENVFFDGSKTELTSNLAVLRLRFYNVDAKCVLSLKAKPVISDGISRVEEQEEPIEPAIGRACIPEAWRLLSIGSSKIMKRVREEYGVGKDGLVCLGGFRNVRQVYEWKGLKLEVDETDFDFGTSYEIECESSEPERVKKILEEFLLENGISYSYSTVSKFAVFRFSKRLHRISIDCQTNDTISSHRHTHFMSVVSLNHYTGDVLNWYIHSGGDKGSTEKWVNNLSAKVDVDLKHHEEQELVMASSDSCHGVI